MLWYSRMNIETITNSLLPWLKNHGIIILAIIIGTFILQKVLKVFISKIIRRLIREQEGGQAAERKREDTLIRILTTAAHVVLWIVAAMMILQEFGIDIGPLIAAAGIVGLAFGFGGQYLIRDLISGLFIILENQYRIGDVVCFDDTCGTVEDLTMRMTTLRDMDGTVHHIPHGEITKVSNMSKTFARVNMDIGVGYGADIDHVMSVTNRVGEELTQDPEWKDMIIKAPQFLRVQELGDSAVVIKVFGDTKPNQQWAVMGELRKRLKNAYDKEGIEIPFPQRVIHQGK